jgi:ferritin-like metal-binding protein YciE
MSPKTLNTRDQKLVQYLVEAHGKERELETALEAHIGMTTHTPYRKRLQQHLAETKRHAREVEKRAKQLGGSIEGNGVLEPIEAVQAIAMKGVALAQGPLHALRGTGEPEKMLKNAKTEYASEAEEIATYRAIEMLADTVGDKETAKVAREIRRDEEKMFAFLERQIDTLTKQVARDEIPAAERNGATATKRRKPAARTRSPKRAKSGSPRSRSSASKSKSRSRAKARS